MNVINFKPSKTIKAFILDFRKGELFYDWIIGPVGSGKTTGLFFKLCYLAGLQAPGRDGIRRTKAVIVRNTMPQLKDTTLASWSLWFKDGQAGRWSATQNTFVLKFGDVECEVLFRPLDTADDIARVLSLEVTFAIVDEFVQIPREIIDALSARLGRYPSAADGGATNWGMWGSSNPDLEDCWWFEYLTNNPAVEIMNVYEDDDRRKARYGLLGLDFSKCNTRYFTQPSGLSPNAENIIDPLTGKDILPGGRDYYTNQCKGKSEAWIKQFVEAEWGFSIAGKPVISTFKPLLHISKNSLIFNPLLPLVIGFDPGLIGSAMVFGQQDLHSRLLIMGELIQENIGAERMIRERLKPYLRRRFPNATRIIVAPDPAAAIRSASDEKTVVQVIGKHYEVKVETNNRLPLRINAIDYYATYLTDIGPALLIDEKECPTVIRALKGGWRYSVNTKKDELKGPDPEKNKWSHAGDAVGYLARYWHRLTMREQRYSSVGLDGKPRPAFVPPRSFSPGYHMR